MLHQLPILIELIYSQIVIVDIDGYTTVIEAVVCCLSRLETATMHLTWNAFPAVLDRPGHRTWLPTRDLLIWGSFLFYFVI